MTSASLLRVSVVTASVRRRRRLWYRWSLASAAGLVLGVGSGALIGWSLLQALDPVAGTLVGALLSALFFALFMGVVLGFAQHRVISWPLPFVKLRVWVSATTLAGIIVWAGANPLLDSLGEGDDRGLLFQVFGAGLVGLAAGLVLGVPQAMVLQPQIEKAWHWVWANAAGWAVAMPVIFLADGSLGSGAGWIRIGLTAVMALAVAGGIAGVVTGRVLVWLVEDRLHPSRYTLDALAGISQTMADNDGPFF